MIIFLNLIALALAGLPQQLAWQGDNPPRQNVYIEVWQRTDADTTWRKVVDELPDPNGVVQQSVVGPAWVKARWRWDHWRFLETYCAWEWKYFPEPSRESQTFFGTFSPVHYVAPLKEELKNQFREHVRVP